MTTQTLLGSLLLGLLIASSGCATQYPVEAGGDYVGGLVNHSAIDPEFGPSLEHEGMGCERVLLVIPKADAATWAPRRERRTAIEAFLTRKGASLVELVPSGESDERLESIARQAECDGILVLDAFAWRDTSSRYFLKGSGDFMVEVRRQSFDSASPDLPKWELLLPEPSRLHLRGTLRVRKRGSNTQPYESVVTFQAELSLAHMPHPGGFGATLEWSGSEAEVLTPSSQEVFGEAARRNAESVLLSRLLELAKSR